MSSVVASQFVSYLPDMFTIFKYIRYINGVKCIIYLLISPFFAFFFFLLQKQMKLTALVHEMCSEMSHLVGKFVHGVGRIDEVAAGTRTTEPTGMGTSKQHSRKRRRQSSPETETLPSDEESYKTDDDDNDEDGSANEESNDGGIDDDGE